MIEVSMDFSRRGWIKAGAAFLARPLRASGAPLRVAGQEVEIQIAPVSVHTVRITVLPSRSYGIEAVPPDGSLIQSSWAQPVARLRTGRPESARCGNLAITLSPTYPTLEISTLTGHKVQQLKFGPEDGALSFATGDAPLLGLGEGGPQFDRRGSIDRMRSGQGGYKLRTHGGRVPIPWLIGTAGWAILFHHPFGTFDLSGPESRFQPASPASVLPLDIFLVASKDPTTILGEYARRTGHPEMPALWSLGYQQSHRTLTSGEEILAEARTFRDKKLPSDTMIYLGTGFCPSGWNTNNGEFAFNKKNLPRSQVHIRSTPCRSFQGCAARGNQRPSDARDRARCL